MRSLSFKLFLVCAFVLLGRPQDVLSFLQPLRPALVFTTLAMAALLFGERQRRLAQAFSQPGTLQYLMFFLVMIIGIPFATHKGLAFASVLQVYSVNVLFYLLLVSHVQSLDELRTFVWTVCLCTLTYAFFGGVLQAGGDGRFQSAGGYLDPNDTAFVLLSLLPMSLFYLKFQPGPWKRPVALMAIGSSIVVILQTGSRGGILGFGTILLLLLVTGLGGMKRSHKAMLVMALLATFVLMKDRIDVERYLSITNVSEDYNVTSDGGRLELWESAIDLTLEHPLTGVGTECFPFAHFQSRERSGESFLRWQYTHNSFLQIASEVGLIGFAIFLAMVLRSLLAFARTAAMGGKWCSGEQLEASVLGGLMLLGFSGLLVTGFFLSQGYSIFFTLYFALAAIMHRVQADLRAGPAASAHSELLHDRPVS